MSGCASSQSTSAPTASPPVDKKTTAIPTTSRPLSDRDTIQQGIDSAQDSCIANLPRDASTDKCILKPEHKEKMINLIVQNITAAEQHCQKVLPRSEDLSLCTISDAKILLISRNTAFCVNDLFFTPDDLESYCLNVQIYHHPWYDKYYLN